MAAKSHAVVLPWLLVIGILSLLFSHLSAHQSLHTSNFSDFSSSSSSCATTRNQKSKSSAKLEPKPKADSTHNNNSTNNNSQFQAAAHSVPSGPNPESN